MNKQHEGKNKMNKEEYIDWISGTCFREQWPSDKIKDFSKYVNEHPELMIRDFIEIAAKGNYPEFLRLIIYKFGPSSFTSEDGKALILFKGYQSPAVADIVIQRRISQEALKEYKNQLGHELDRIYNLDKGNLTIAYAKISDAITSKQKGQTMNNTNNEHQEKIYTNRDGFKNYTLASVLEYVSDTENINKWLEKPMLPDWVKKGARFKVDAYDKVYEISDIDCWTEIVRCRGLDEFRFLNFVAPIGKVPNCVPVEEEDGPGLPKWSDIGHWVYDKEKKYARYVDSTSYSLSNVGNVALGFSDGKGWVGTIDELKQRFSPAEVKIVK